LQLSNPKDAQVHHLVIKKRTETLTAFTSAAWSNSCHAIATRAGRWPGREKRGEQAPLDLSGVLVVQLGLVTKTSTLATGFQTSSAMRSIGPCPGWPRR